MVSLNAVPAPRVGLLAALVALLAGLSVALAGCGSDSEQSESEAQAVAAAESEEGVSSQRVEESHVELEAAPAQLGPTRGTITRSAGVLRPGAELEPGERLETMDGEVAINLRDGGRLRLDPEGRVVLGQRGERAQIYLVRGAAHVMQPPAGSSPRPPLRVATPSATVEIGASGELFLYVHPSGSTWVAVLSGRAGITVGEVDGHRRLRSLELDGGHAVAVAAHLAEPTEGPTRLEGARAAARVIGEGLPEEVEPERLGRSLRDHGRQLDTALGWLETETRRGQELTRSHREAVREGQEEEGARIQRELVGHSQQLYRLREIASARWERLRGMALLAALHSAMPTEDPVAARRDRVAGLLGF